MVKQKVDNNPLKIRPVENLRNSDKQSDPQVNGVPVTLNFQSDFVWVESFYTIEDKSNTTTGAVFDIILKRTAACIREDGQSIWTWSAVRIDTKTELFGGEFRLLQKSNNSQERWQ